MSRRPSLLLTLITLLTIVALLHVQPIRTTAQGEDEDEIGDPIALEDEFIPEEDEYLPADSGGGQSSSGGSSGGSNVPTSGKYVAALNFKLDVNAFNFQNYGSDKPYKNLTSEDVHRLFGDQVCSSISGSQCVLSAVARQWMADVNEMMGGGHCYGMAALTSLMHLKELDPADFGASSVFDLKIDGNQNLQREIATWFSTQTTPEVQNGIADYSLAPNDILDKLIQDFKAGGERGAYIFAFFKRDRSGGHAVTPYAVEDRGNGKYWILVYDNNWPNSTRAFEFDRNKNAWAYEASINPNEQSDVYEGDDDSLTLALIPVSLKLKPMTCPFCEESSGAWQPGSLAALAPPKVTYNQIWLDSGDLLITDDKGRRHGVSGGKFYREIPGVHVQPIFSGDLWKDEESPVYLVPTGTKVTLTIDGSRLKKEHQAELVVMGPGYYIGLEEIKLSPKQKDTLIVSPDGTRLSYKTDSGESPTMILGFDSKGADYSFAVAGVDLERGATITVALDKAKSQLSVSTVGNKSAGAYGLAIGRYDQQGEQVFSHDEDITLEPNDTAYINYGKWPGNKQPLQLQIDYKSDGSIDETIDLTDE